MRVPGTRRLGVRSRVPPLEMSTISILEPAADLIPRIEGASEIPYRGHCRVPGPEKSLIFIDPNPPLLQFGAYEDACGPHREFYYSLQQKIPDEKAERKDDNTP